MNAKDLQKEYDKLGEELQDPELISDWEKFAELSKRRGYLEKVVAKQKEVQELGAKIAESEQIVAAQEDPDLVSMAEQELAQLSAQKAKAEQELRRLAAEPEELPDAAIVEIRPGTGGEEASLFARDLYDMYAKFAEQQGWRVTPLSVSETELGGVKEAALEVKGENAWRYLRHEAGVHRVQRIPETEKQGRVHTSAASVAVLAKPETSEIQIKPEDLEVDTYRSSGKGGQNVNKRETAVRITHKPTGLVVTCQTERSQQQNKENALNLLAARLAEQREIQAAEKTATARASQIGTGERSEKIRTYNFPQDRVTDHRVKKTWHGIESVLGGNLKEISEELEEVQQSAQRS